MLRAMASAPPVEGRDFTVMPSDPSLSSSSLPIGEDPNLSPEGSPPGIGGEPTGSYAPHGKTRISGSDSDATRACDPSPSPLPAFPWRCVAVDACDSAREGAECRHDSEAGPDCAATCAAFRPAPLPRELTYIPDDPRDVPRGPAPLALRGAAKGLAGVVNRLAELHPEASERLASLVGGLLDLAAELDGAARKAVRS